jgi:hypothetical protein
MRNEKFDGKDETTAGLKVAGFEGKLTGTGRTDSKEGT